MLVSEEALRFKSNQRHDVKLFLPTTSTFKLTKEK